MQPLTLDTLNYPFHVVSNSAHLMDIDTSFSYHVLLTEDKAYAMCNDIPCSVCQFSCKNGTNRNKILVEFAKVNFPEMRI